MGTILLFTVSFLMIIIALIQGYFVGFPLTAALILFCTAALHKGVSFNALTSFLRSGVQKSLLVIRIFALIGGITAAWMTAGTVPGIVYYSLQLLHPHYFFLIAFVVSCVVSFLLGTSLGTTGTLGVALMMLARTGQANPSMAAGALIAGAYFGDRFSPMSSSANLVATITETNLYRNLRNMAATMWLPFIVSCVLYGLLSFRYPLDLDAAVMDAQLADSFLLHPLVLLPAVVMLGLSALRVDVKISMASSLITAILLSLFFQGREFGETGVFLVTGFQLPDTNPLAPIIQGGGLLSMVRPSVIVLVSCILAEVIHGGRFLQPVIWILNTATTRIRLYSYTLLTSILSGAFGGTQSVSIILTGHLMQEAYQPLDAWQETLALDLEDTSVLVAALIPWNVAALFPTTVLQVDRTGFMPYAFFLFLLPLFNLIRYRFSRQRPFTASAKTNTK